ncbi:MAG: hypothetical protein RMI01_09790 [Thermodesulfovibrio sp.]|nr:hypothetical protein [Thermodesulfovibrio sp.]
MAKKITCIEIAKKIREKAEQTGYRIWIQLNPWAPGVARILLVTPDDVEDAGWLEEIYGGFDEALDVLIKSPNFLRSTNERSW